MFNWRHTHSSHLYGIMIHQGFMSTHVHTYVVHVHCTYVKWINLICNKNFISMNTEELISSLVLKLSVSNSRFNTMVAPITQPLSIFLLQLQIWNMKLKNCGAQALCALDPSHIVTLCSLPQPPPFARDLKIQDSQFQTNSCKICKVIPEPKSHNLGVSH